MGSCGSIRIAVGISFVKLPSSIENVSYANGAMALPYWIDALLPNEAAGLKFNTLLGSTKQFTYSFPSALPSYNTSTDDANGFSAFNDTQKAFVRLALAYIETVVDVKFVDTFGTWQHFSVPIGELTEEVFEDGFGFDG